MMSLTKRGLAPLAVAIVLASSGTALAQGSGKWTDVDYRSYLIGKTVSISAMFRGNRFNWIGYYRSDGTAIGLGWGRGWKTDGIGRWRLRRGALCVEWTVPDWSGCFVHRHEGGRIVNTATSGPHKGQTYRIKVLGNGNVKNLR